MRRTSLFKFHKEHGHLGEYAGYEMPLWYKGTLVERMSGRNNVGIFDVSHMGRLLITGSQATSLLNRLLTNNCALIEIMESQHAFFCNNSGGIIDDVLVFLMCQPNLINQLSQRLRLRKLFKILKDQKSRDIIKTI